MSLHFASAVDIAAGVRAGEHDPVDVVESFLDRIERRNAVTNAFVTVLRDEARERAAAVRERVDAGEALPLAGVPVAVKDLSETKTGVPNTMGLAPFADDVDRVVLAGSNPCCDVDGGREVQAHGGASTPGNLEVGDGPR